MGKKAKKAKQQAARWATRRSDMIDKFGWWGGGRGDFTYPVVSGPVREVTVVSPPPPPNPALTRAIFDATTDIKVWEGPVSLEGLRKPRTVFLTGKGFVTVLDTPLATFVGTPSGTALLDGTDIPTPGVSLKVAKVEWSHFLQTVAFFRAVMKARSGAEALIQFYWDPTAKALFPFVPEQRVSGGSVRYEGVHDPEGKFLHLLDIHSHNSMGAFWSSTDNADESRFEGRFFGVIGNLDKPLPSVKMRARAGGAFLDLQLDDLIAMPPPMDITVRVEHATVWRTLAEGKSTAREVKMSFPYDPFAGVTFPPEWMEKVLTYQSHVTHGGTEMIVYGGGGRRGHQKGDVITWDKDGNKLVNGQPFSLSPSEAGHGRPFDLKRDADSHEILVEGGFVKLPGREWMSLAIAHAEGLWPVAATQMQSTTPSSPTTSGTSMASPQTSMLPLRPSSTPTTGTDTPVDDVDGEGKIGSRSRWVYNKVTGEVFNEKVGLPWGVPSLIRCSSVFTIDKVRKAFPQGVFEEVYYVNPARIMAGVIVRPRMKEDGTPDGRKLDEGKEAERGTSPG